MSIVDAGEKPLLGLGAADFTVTRAGRTAKIVSVEPIAESVDVPRHIVLVLDNSYSMVERQAVKALLQGVGELLKIVRPIDDVRMIVFDDRASLKLGGRDLRVRTLASSKPAELQEFAAAAYRDGVTSKTVLYEAMLAGLELLRGMPAGDPRFLVVFSDGEDINSAYGTGEVASVAKELEGFRPFAVDYMPGPALDPFLAKFAAQGRGQAWKAKSETNLVPIFQQVASTMQYYYVVTYLFPPAGSLDVSPAGLSVSRVQAFDGAGKDAKPQAAALETGIDRSSLTLKPVVDSAYGVARWRVAVENAKGGVAEVSGEGAPPAEVEVPLPAAKLQALAAGGDLAVKMDVQDQRGQSLVLTAPPVKVAVASTRASVSVSPALVTVDEVRLSGASPKLGVDPSALALRPALESPGWVAAWTAVVANAKGAVAEAAGAGAPPAEISVPLPAGGLPALGAGGDLTVKLELQDKRGQRLALASAPVKVVLAQTRAALAVAPAAVTVEEVKTIDSSPTLAHVYFDKGSSEIPARYKRFGGPGETAEFGKQAFRDTLDKYYQLLNIVGRRLAADPGAKVTLVGCNDGTAEERRKKGLSAKRAEAVKSYLQTVWGIAPDRLSVEARGLPQLPSAARTREGEAENRRVEIVPSNPAVVAPVRSVYTTLRVDTPALTVRPDVVAAYGVDRWQVTATNAGGAAGEVKGTGVPPKEAKIPLDGGDLRKLATGGDLAVKLEVLDFKGHRFEVAPAPVKVGFSQISQMAREKKDQRVQEKYALILFDFDKDTVGPANKEIVGQIAERIRALSKATAEVVGHTDNSGKDAYNLKLSERRALAVYQLLSGALGGAGGDRIRHSGVGASSPLYDNQSPETRAFNRTVTIVLEYLSAE
ncbi:MAG: OmpA family protein [Deltaproteobacteria bacterium]|nr:OmpA family protein [Deltaproteobacteria bacterium]